MPRIRDALEALAADPRERITLVLALFFAMLIASNVFLYLLLRRR